MSVQKQLPGFHHRAHAFGEAAARICRLWGVSPLLGRLYVALLLSPEPRSLEETARLASAAKSTVSVALRQLLRLGLIKRVPVRGDRRDFYTVEADLWQVLRDLLRDYLQPEAEMWRTHGTAMREALAAPDAPAGSARAEIAQRLETLSDMVESMDAMLQTLTGRIPGPAARTIPIVREGQR